eukprot:5701578-Amphidinium_carterae.1
MKEALINARRHGNEGLPLDVVKGRLVKVGYRALLLAWIQKFVEFLFVAPRPSHLQLNGSASVCCLDRCILRVDIPPYEVSYFAELYHMRCGYLFEPFCDDRPAGVPRSGRPV